MVVTKAISQRVLVAASIISLLLIAGSIYLQLQQKHHLGRMNINERRVKPTEDVENLPKDDVVNAPPLQTIPPNISVTKSNNFNRKSYNDYSEYDDIYKEEYNLPGDDYPNDATSIQNSHEDMTDDPKDTHKSSTVPYVIDNAYRTDLDIEYANPSSGDEHLNSSDKFGLTENFFHCLCTTVNGCKPFKCAHIDPCGIYGISKNYWLDGGSLTATVENSNDYGEEDNQTHIEYIRCVNNEICAKETVGNYIRRYQRDCNNDDVIDFQDHIMLHILGPSGCFNRQLSPIHKIRMQTCLK